MLSLSLTKLSSLSFSSSLYLSRTQVFTPEDEAAVVSSLQALDLSAMCVFFFFKMSFPLS